MGHPPFHDDLLAADSEAETKPRVGRIHGGRANIRRVQRGHGPAQHDDEADRPDERGVLAPEQQHAQPEAERDLEPQRGVRGHCGLAGQRRLPVSDAAAAAAERRPVRPAGQRDARPGGGGILRGREHGAADRHAAEPPLRSTSAAATEWISCSTAATTGIHAAAAALATADVATATTAAAAKFAQN